jgi:hypothetical protein
MMRRFLLRLLETMLPIALLMLAMSGNDSCQGQIGPGRTVTFSTTLVRAGFP